MAVSAYKIAVNIMAVNGVSSVVRAIGRDVMGLGNRVDAVNKKFGQWRTTALLVGSAMTAIGAAALLSEKKIIRMGDAIVRQREMLRAIGVSGPAAAGAEVFAKREALAIRGTTPAENLAVLRELRATLGSLGVAEQAFPAVVKATVALKAFGIQSATSGRYMIDVSRAIDVLGGSVKGGKFSPKQFGQLYNVMTGANIMSGGQFSAQQFLRLARTGSLAGQLGGNPIKFFESALAVMMQLGPRAGSGFMQMISQLVGGKISIGPLFMGLKKYGIIRPGGYQDVYGHYYLKPGGLVGTRTLISQGPIAWLQKVLVPKLHAEGINTTAQIAAALTRIFGSVRTMRLAGVVTMPGPAKIYARDVRLIAEARHGAFYSRAMKTFGGASLAAHAALVGVGQVTGEQGVPIATRIAQSFTGGVLAIEKYANAHPKAAQAALNVLGALAAGLVAFGTAAIATALLTTPTGLVALATAVGVLGATLKKWRPILYAISGGIAGAKIGGLVGLAVGSPFVGAAIGTAAGAAIGAGYGLYQNGAFRGVRVQSPANDFWHSPLSGYGGALGLSSLDRKPLVPNGHFHAGGGEAGDVYLDGDKVGQHVTRYQAKGLQTNPSTPVGHNLRRGFLPPGLPMMPSPVS